jgi:hypothetical protein
VLTDALCCADRRGDTLTDAGRRIQEFAGVQKQ